MNWEEKGFKVGDTLAMAVFKVSGTNNMGNVIDDEVRAELTVSGAFKYGNQTCMALIWKNSGWIDSYDTRYDKVTPHTFSKFAKEVLKGNASKNVKFLQIKKKVFVK